ncbi:hypothetical protein LAZ67_18001950 [Cordylochernes scorpioides]|uniref:LRRCT domain-containing protein n=1 Tax=Cordylochernes scorpioides TaxID=51811 RepID=A0ABY6LGI5_9ARAC|nr:hypothetical protein LAZ67_18001950 [Cordylochernes scorpioides]
MYMVPLPALQNLVENHQRVSSDTTYFVIYEENALFRGGTIDGFKCIFFFLISTQSYEGIKLVKLVDGNPWHCDQALGELAGQLLRRELGLKDVFCHTPPAMSNRSLAVAALYTHVNSSPTCSQCFCKIQDNRTYIEVHCQYLGLTKLPASLPAHTKVVHLENNQISSLALDHANEEDWQSVIYLFLDNNTISSLKDIEGSAAVLARNLVLLHLSHNQLTIISPHLLNLFPDLVELSLGYNPLECNCYTYQFQTWLQEHFKMVTEISTITCKEDGRPIYKLPKPELCLSQSLSITHYLDVVNTLLGVATIAIAAKLALDCYHSPQEERKHRWSSYTPGSTEPNNSLQLLLRCRLYLVKRSVTSSFHGPLQFREQEKVTGGQIWGIRWLRHH